MTAADTALVLIGFQKDYFDSNGRLREALESDVEQVRNNVRVLLENLRESAVMAVATPIIFTRDYQELKNPVGILSVIKETQAFQEGSEGSNLIPEVISPRVDVVPGKRGLNCFLETGLDKKFRERGIRNIVLTGAITSICIDSTGRSAHEKGYNVYILSDVTCARTPEEQDFYLRRIYPLYSTVLSSDDLLQVLKAPVNGESQ